MITLAPQITPTVVVALAASFAVLTFLWFRIAQTNTDGPPATNAEMFWMASVMAAVTLTVLIGWYVVIAKTYRYFNPPRVPLPAILEPRESSADEPDGSEASSSAGMTGGSYQNGFPQELYPAETITRVYTRAPTSAQTGE